MHFEYENYFLSFKTTLAVCYSFALLYSFYAHSHAIVVVIVLPTFAHLLCPVLSLSCRFVWCVCACTFRCFRNKIYAKQLLSGKRQKDGK
ncbi:unnamed protein product [Ceratitis capitata]|uniref:(Mediterranean fruit fly) hypothetical protein n=1 Tax=Ceratitis capitata TaxID=7213 RepID=A0A811VB98_CERCA|nr:unnamed protein product [Ceratitis capitata]